jgi:hypothetical protein
LCGIRKKKGGRGRKRGEGRKEGGREGGREGGMVPILSFSELLISFLLLLSGNFTRETDATLQTCPTFFSVPHCHYPSHNQHFGSLSGSHTGLCIRIALERC